MSKFLHLIIGIIFLPIYLFSETVTIYATQSAQYSANDCCTLNTLTNQNGNSLYSQDCQDMGAYYGCGMSKLVPFWIFDLSTIDSSIDIQSIQFKGNLPTESWLEVYLSISTTVGQISTTIASDLWSGGDWDSGNGEYSSINWPMGDFSQNLPSEIISQGIISGQLNILTYTSNPWTIFSIVNSGDNAPRLVIDYDNINENCTADDGTEGVELWDVCYSIENTDSLDLNNNGLTGEIPPEIGNLTNLSDLRLYGNQLTGAIPPEIGNLTNLTRLDLENNQLTGSIPTEIGNLTNLTYLYLNSNQLTREIPESICDLNISWDGWEFNISNNQLCPPYPSCIEDYVGEQNTTDCEQVSIIDETLPITYNLHNAYPNPFNPITTLQYDIPENANVNITIYDMMGRQVKTLVNGSQTAGYRSIQWNATNDRNESVSAGLYLYTIQAGDFRQTKKMVLLK